MKLSSSNNIFDLLAVLCSLLSKDAERKAAIKWRTADEEQIQKVLSYYKPIMQAVYNMALSEEYTFDDRMTAYINNELERLETLDEWHKDEIFLLIIEIENKLKRYDEVDPWNEFQEISPLNMNHKETGIRIYPYFKPFWDTGKSERGRELLLNTRFSNYMMFRESDQDAFEIVMHYWGDEGILCRTEDGLILKAAISPVSDSVRLVTEDHKTGSGNVITVTGIEEKKEVEERIIRTFEAMFERGNNIIMFPEAIGTADVVEKVKIRMREHPERCVFVLLPTICENKENRLIVLGPGGVEVLSCRKGTPFILRDGHGGSRRENLEYTNELHVFITRELGYVAFPICAELLDPQYYRTMVQTARVNTMFCQSFSPGINAFRKTLMKGVSTMMLGFWLNTCSAKSVSIKSCISDTIGIVQLPDCSGSQQSLLDIKRMCDGVCADNMCYYELTVRYSGGRFLVEQENRFCA